MACRIGTSCFVGIKKIMKELGLAFGIIFGIPCFGYLFGLGFKEAWNLDKKKKK